MCFLPGRRLECLLYPGSRHRSWSLSHGHPRISSVCRSCSRWWGVELDSVPQLVTHFLFHLRFIEVLYFINVFLVMLNASLKYKPLEQSTFNKAGEIWTFLLNITNYIFTKYIFAIYFTSCVSPASYPAVVSWFEVGLLARQAGVADEVSGLDILGSFDQCDVIIQLTVSRITEVLVSVDPLHRENSLSRLWSLQLVLTQNDTPAVSVLCFSPGQQHTEKHFKHILHIFSFLIELSFIELELLPDSLCVFCIYEVLLLKAVCCSKNPVLVDQGPSAHMDVMFTSPGTDLWKKIQT